MWIKIREFLITILYSLVGIIGFIILLPFLALIVVAFPIIMILAIILAMVDD